MTTTFLLMYHPLIPSTITTPVRVAAQAVDEQAAQGWLLVDPEGTLPDPVTPYYTKEALLSQIQGGASPIGTALRAALVAPLPTVGAFTYNPDGTVASDTDGNTYTWNADGTPATQTKGGVTRTFHWNADGTVASVS